MSLIGKWNIKKMISFSEDGPKLLTLEEMKALGDMADEEYVFAMENCFYEITEDGHIYNKAIVPEDKYEEVKSEGEQIEQDGTIILECYEWKEENGEYFYDTGEEREVMGGEISSWDKLALNEEGLLPFSMGIMLLEKAD